jgi:hypothetical protein
MESFKNFLDAFVAPYLWFLSQSPYISLTIIGVIVAVMLTLAGFTLARMGYKPLWAVVLLLPNIGLIFTWLAAYRKFPREKL